MLVAWSVHTAELELERGMQDQLLILCVYGAHTKTTTTVLFCMEVAVLLSPLPYWTKEIVGSYGNLNKRLLI